MATRKVHVKVTVDLFMVVDEGTEVSEVINEMDYSFSDTTGKADIQDTTILDQEVTDSR